MMHVEVKGAVMATSPKVKSEQGDAEDVLRRALGDEKANALIANRVKRDGDKAHITLLGPPDAKKAITEMAARDGISKGEAEKKLKELAAKGVPEDFRVKGVGRAESGGKVAYFVVVDWPGGRAFRESLGLDPDSQDFHITVGFGDGGDVHGVPKKRVLSEGDLAKTARLSGYTSATGMTLRSKVIRLAHANPSLRPHLLPLLSRTAKFNPYAGTPVQREALQRIDELAGEVAKKLQAELPVDEEGGDSYSYVPEDFDLMGLVRKGFASRRREFKELALLAKVSEQHILETLRLAIEGYSQYI